MGVTFYPAGNQAETYTKGRQTGGLLSKSYTSIHGNRSIAPNDVYVSSFLDGQKQVLVPVCNGFVETVLEAYQRHRMLIIRPDDVWLAILSQFNFFVNKNAEALRNLFVSHEGKKALTLATNIPSRYRIDVASAALQFTELMHENITDPSVRDWIMPDFTTTTPLDKSVAAITMMSTFQKFFSFMMAGCGIPAVTLEGEKKDYENILRRIEKLKEYGAQTTAWYHLLRPVLKRFITALDDPNSAENADFWNRVSQQGPLMSGGGQKLTGWITAFCVFGKDGRWMGPRFKDEYVPVVGKESEFEELSATEFAEKYLLKDAPYGRGRDDKEPPLVLDGVRYHTVWRIPPSVAGVDITIVENSGQSYNAAMIAGLAAYEVLSSGDKTHSVSGEMDTVKPAAGWWLFAKPPTPALGCSPWGDF